MSGTRDHRFYWVDVFADKPYEGNPLTVVLGSQDLDDYSMHKIAQEFGNSETTFVEAFSSVEENIKTRIFGLTGEMPFAGHPSLGTAFAVRGNSGAREVSLGLKVGKISITFDDLEEGTLCEMTQPDPVFGEIHSKDMVAEAIGADPDSIRDDLPVETVSTGNSFVLVPFNRLEDLSHFHMSVDRAVNYLHSHQSRFFYLYSFETQDKRNLIHARMIYEKGEDPATGSAAGPLIAYLLKYDIVGSSKSVWIEQGSEIRRPSRIRIRGIKAGDEIRSIKVAGKCFKIGEGIISI
ncbi:MAG: PhzF family phenazine biosynthesis protein [Thermoplasmataceae archaeon]